MQLAKADTAEEKGAKEILVKPETKMDVVKPEDKKAPPSQVK